MTSQDRIAVVIEQDPDWLETVENMLTRVSVRVVGQTGSFAEARRLIEQHRPELVVVDTASSEGDTNGSEWLRELLDRFPRQRVIALASSSAADELEATLSGGASVCVVKSTHPEGIVSAARMLDIQTVYLPSERAENATRPPVGREVGRLTRRQSAILLLAAEGLSNEAIAKQLGVSQPTVKFHLGSIYRKLGVKNRTEAGRWAHDQGLLSRQQTDSSD